MYAVSPPLPQQQQLLQAGTGLQQIYRSKYRMSYGCHYAAAGAYDNSVYVVQHDFKILRLYSPEDPRGASPGDLSSAADAASSRVAVAHSAATPAAAAANRRSDARPSGRRQRHGDGNSRARVVNGRSLEGAAAGQLQQPQQHVWRQDVLVDVLPYLYCNYRQEYTKLFTGNKQFDIPRMQELRRTCCLMTNPRDGLLYFLLHNTLFRISLLGVMTPVADLVLAAVHLLREHHEQRRQELAAACALPQQQTQHQHAGGACGSQSSISHRSHRRTLGDSSSCCSLIANDLVDRIAPTAPGVCCTCLRNRAENGVGAGGFEETSGAARVRAWLARMQFFHGRTSRLAPANTLEVGSCCIDGRGWCFFTIQQKEDETAETDAATAPSRAVAAAAASSAAGALTEVVSTLIGGTAAESNQQGTFRSLLLCLDTGVASPVIRLVYFPEEVDIDNILLSSVAGHPLGGITCATDRLSCDAKRKKRRSRTHGHRGRGIDGSSRGSSSRSTSRLYWSATGRVAGSSGSEYLVRRDRDERTSALYADDISSALTFPLSFRSSMRREHLHPGAADAGAVSEEEELLDESATGGSSSSSSDEEEEEEEDVAARGSEDGRRALSHVIRSDWWFYPLHQEQPWKLIPMMEVLNHAALHALAQRTTLHFDGTLDDSVCVYAFDGSSECCWLLWQPGRLVWEKKGRETVNLGSAYLIRLPAAHHWREARRCLRALREAWRPPRSRGSGRLCSRCSTHGTGVVGSGATATTTAAAEPDLPPTTSSAVCVQHSASNSCSNNHTQSSRVRAANAPSYCQAERGTCDTNGGSSVTCCCTRARCGCRSLCACPFCSSEFVCTGSSCCGNISSSSYRSCQLCNGSDSADAGNSSGTARRSTTHSSSDRSSSKSSSGGANGRKNGCCCHSNDSSDACTPGSTCGRSLRGAGQLHTEEHSCRGGKEEEGEQPPRRTHGHEIHSPPTRSRSSSRKHPCTTTAFSSSTSASSTYPSAAAAVSSASSAAATAPAVSSPVRVGNSVKCKWACVGPPRRECKGFLQTTVSRRASVPAHFKYSCSRNMSPAGTSSRCTNGALVSCQANSLSPLPRRRSHSLLLACYSPEEKTGGEGGPRWQERGHSSETAQQHGQNDAGEMQRILMDNEEGGEGKDKEEGYPKKGRVFQFGSADSGCGSGVAHAAQLPEKNSADAGVLSGASSPPPVFGAAASPPSPAAVSPRDPTRGPSRGAPVSTCRTSALCRGTLDAAAISPACPPPAGAGVAACAPAAYTYMRDPSFACCASVRRRGFTTAAAVARRPRALAIPPVAPAALSIAATAGGFASPSAAAVSAASAGAKAWEEWDTEDECCSLLSDSEDSCVPAAFFSSPSSAATALDGSVAAEAEEAAAAPQLLRIIGQDARHLEVREMLPTATGHLLVMVEIGNRCQSSSAGESSSLRLLPVASVSSPPASGREQRPPPLRFDSTWNSSTHSSSSSGASHLRREPRPSVSFVRNEANSSTSTEDTSDPCRSSSSTRRIGGASGCSSDSRACSSSGVPRGGSSTLPADSCHSNVAPGSSTGSVFPRDNSRGSELGISGGQRRREGDVDSGTEVCSRQDGGSLRCMESGSRVGDMPEANETAPRSSWGGEDTGLTTCNREAVGVTRCSSRIHRRSRESELHAVDKREENKTSEIRGNGSSASRFSLQSATTSSSSPSRVFSSSSSSPSPLPSSSSFSSYSCPSSSSLAPSFGSSTSRAADCRSPRCSAAAGALPPGAAASLRSAKASTGNSVSTRTSSSSSTQRTSAHPAVSSGSRAAPAAPLPSSSSSSSSAPRAADSLASAPGAAVTPSSECSTTITASASPAPSYSSLFATSSSSVFAPLTAVLSWSVFSSGSTAASPSSSAGEAAAPPRRAGSAAASRNASPSSSVSAARARPPANLVTSRETAAAAARIPGPSDASAPSRLDADTAAPAAEGRSVSGLPLRAPAASPHAVRRSSGPATGAAAGETTRQQLATTATAPRVETTATASPPGEAPTSSTPAEVFRVAAAGASSQCGPPNSASSAAPFSSERRPASPQQQQRPSSCYPAAAEGVGPYNQRHASLHSAAASTQQQQAPLSLQRQRQVLGVPAGAAVASAAHLGAATAAGASSSLDGAATQDCAIHAEAGEKDTGEFDSTVLLLIDGLSICYGEDAEQPLQPFTFAAGRGTAWASPLQLQAAAGGCRREAAGGSITAFFASEGRGRIGSVQAPASTRKQRGLSTLVGQLRKVESSPIDPSCPSTAELNNAARSWLPGHSRSMQDRCTLCLLTLAARSSPAPPAAAAAAAAESPRDDSSSSCAPSQTLAAARLDCEGEPGRAAAALVSGLPATRAAAWPAETPAAGIPAATEGTDSATWRGLFGLHDRFLDVELCCSDGVRLYSHRALLAARSPFFEAMLTRSRWKEQHENEIAATAAASQLQQTGGPMWRLSLPGYSSRVVAALLVYLATDRFTMPSRCCCQHCCPFFPRHARQSVSDGTREGWGYRSSVGSCSKGLSSGGRGGCSTGYYWTAPAAQEWRSGGESSSSSSCSMQDSRNTGIVGWRGEQQRTSVADKTAGCFRCTYTWLLEVYDCAAFWLLQALQVELLHMICRHINKYNCLEALCNPLSRRHPRLLRYAAALLLLHFPSPLRLLQPPSRCVQLAAASPASVKREGGGTAEKADAGCSAAAAAASVTASPAAVGEVEHTEARKTSTAGNAVSRWREGVGWREDGTSQTYLEVLARPPVVEHVLDVSNTWFQGSPAANAVIAQVTQHVLAHATLYRREAGRLCPSACNGCGGEREGGQGAHCEGGPPAPGLFALLRHAVLLFFFGCRVSLSPGAHRLFETLSLDVAFRLQSHLWPQPPPPRPPAAAGAAHRVVNRSAVTARVEFNSALPRAVTSEEESAAETPSCGFAGHQTGSHGGPAADLDIACNRSDRGGRRVLEEVALKPDGSSSGKGILADFPPHLLLSRQARECMQEVPFDMWARTLRLPDTLRLRIKREVEVFAAAVAAAAATRPG